MTGFGISSLVNGSIHPPRASSLSDDGVNKIAASRARPHRRVDGLRLCAASRHKEIIAGTCTPSRELTYHITDLQPKRVPTKPKSQQKPLLPESAVSNATATQNHARRLLEVRRHRGQRRRKRYKGRQEDKKAASTPIKHVKCANCGDTEAVLKACQRCKKVAYCGARCQRDDWRFHKRVCCPPKDAKKKEPPTKPKPPKKTTPARWNRRMTTTTNP